MAPDLKAKGFSDEEIGAKQVSIDEYDKSDFKYAFNHFMTPILDDYRRFLVTIAAKNRRIWNLEKLITIDADKRASDRRSIDTIATDRKEPEKYRQGWLVKENKKLKKRIEELEGINKVHRDLRPDETGVLHIIKLKEDVARQAATIERLKGALEDDGPVVKSLAAYAHEAWSGWMKYLFKVSVTNSDGTVTIPQGLVERWSFQSQAIYADLPDNMKPSDRDEAREMLEIIRKAIDGKEDK